MKFKDFSAKDVLYLVSAFVTISTAVALFYKADYNHVFYSVLGSLLITLLLIQIYELYKTVQYKKEQISQLKILQGQEYKLGYHKVAVTGNMRIYKEKVEFDFYKYIQCKKEVMNEYVHRYGWAGTEIPTVYTAMQESVKIGSGSKDDTFIATLKFAKPLLYNQSASIHLFMRFEKEYNLIGDFFDFRVDEAVELIKWNIEFPDTNRRKLGQMKPAYLETRAIGGYNSGFNRDRKIKVAYDNEMNRYYYRLVRPKTGFVYRLTWAEEKQNT